MKVPLPLRYLFRLSIVVLPWPLKRPLLQTFFGYRLDPSAHIGLAWIFPTRLVMLRGSRIDSLTIAINLDALHLGSHASIGRGNWITGFPTGTPSPHFSHQTDRRAELHLGDHSAITKNHHIDCTDKVTIGEFTTVAGYRSQFLTHSLDLKHNCQHSSPITIGPYCFVGSNCIVLGGSVLPGYCVLGALSLLNKQHSESWSLYAGQPARRLQSISPDSLYFHRSEGYVV